MSNNLTITIIGGNSILNEIAADLVKEEFPESMLTMFKDEKAFAANPLLNRTDAIIADRTYSLAGWKYFVSKVIDSNPACAVILITDNLQKELAAEMTKTGVFDLLTASTLTRLIPVIHRIKKEKADREEMQILSMEKAFGDQITNSSRSMLSIINRKYVYEKVNEAFSKAFNTPPDEILGRSLIDIWGTDVFESKIRKNVDLCLEGNIIRYESSFNTPQFGNRYYEVIFRPVRSYDGSITHLLAETFDITELRVSQQVLREMEDEFKKLESNFPIGFLRCDTKGSIIHANKAFLNIIECDDEKDIIGLSPGDFYCEKELFRIHLAQLNTDKINSFGRVLLHSSKGNEVACRISGFAVMPGNGHDVYIDFAFEDSSRELMLENRLLQAQKLETIGSLAGGIAHDFNNILAIINGYTELVIDELPPDSENSERLHKVLGAVTKARSLTNQILTFSRQLEQDKIPISVKEVLKETVEFVKSAKPDNIEIEYNDSSADLKTLADPTQLFRVFLNLMTNALQSMEQHGGILSVNCRVSAGKNLSDILHRGIVADDYIIVSVEDSGSGMDQTVMNRIFEPYFTTKGIGKGTGLGLSVVHGIVSEIEGEVVVSSTKERGSVFTVYLPSTSVADIADTKTAERRTILFLSNNRHESRILSMGLEKKGYNLIHSANLASITGTTGADRISADMIILCDDVLNIPPDGYEKLRIDTLRNIPLIIIADIEHNKIKEYFLNSGLVRQVLNKPVSLKEIDEAIQILLT